MKYLKKLPKFDQWFYIGIFILLVKSILSHSTLLPISNLMDDLMSVLSCFFLGIPCIFKKYSHKSIIMCFIIVLCALLTCKKVDNLHLFIPIILIITSYKEDLNKLINFIFKTELVIFILHIILSIIFSFYGFEIIFVKAGGINTLTLGFSHPNILALFVLNLISMWAWLNYDFISKNDYIIIGIVTILTFVISKSRTTLISIILLFGLIFIMKYLKQNKILEYTKFLFPTCSIVTIISVILYPYNIKIINVINLLFSKRIQLGSKGLLNYGFTLFGQKINYYQGFTFDNIYNVLFVNYGVIWIIICSILFYLLARKGNIKNNIFIIIWCFYGFTEIHGMNPFLYFPLLLVVELMNGNEVLDKIEFFKKYSIK